MATTDTKPADKAATKTLAEEPTRGAHGEGIQQTEPKPEDYPASAKITPPAEQLNSTLSQAVGAAGDETIADLVADSTDKHGEASNKAKAQTDAEFERRAQAN